MRRKLLYVLMWMMIWMSSGWCPVSHAVPPQEGDEKKTKVDDAAAATTTGVLGKRKISQLQKGEAVATTGDEKKTKVDDAAAATTTGVLTKRKILIREKNLIVEKNLLRNDVRCRENIELQLAIFFFASMLKQGMKTQHIKKFEAGYAFSTVLFKLPCDDKKTSLCVKVSEEKAKSWKGLSPQEMSDALLVAYQHLVEEEEKSGGVVKVGKKEVEEQLAMVVDSFYTSFPQGKLAIFDKGIRPDLLTREDVAPEDIEIPEIPPQEDGMVKIALLPPHKMAVETKTLQTITFETKTFEAPNGIVIIFSKE